MGMRMRMGRVAIYRSAALLLVDLSIMTDIHGIYI